MYHVILYKETKEKNMNLKAYLANINMSMKDFALSLGCNTRYLSQISSGKKIPSHRLAKDIEQATDGIIKIDVSMKNNKEQKRQTAAVT